jgi:hypothetical protein
MITFKLEDKAAEAMMAVLNASSPNASFVEELNTQYNTQTVVAEPPAAAVAAFMAEEPHEQFNEETPEPEALPEEE